MKLNNETERVLEKGGLGWILSFIPDHAKEYFVELIDLNTLSLKAKGHQSDYVGFHAETKVLLFGRGGELLGEVGGIQERIVWVTAPTWRWPFLKKIEKNETYYSHKTVEEALLELERAAEVRFIVDIPTRRWSGDQRVTIYKLRNSDPNLKARLQRKSEEAISELQEVLEA